MENDLHCAGYSFTSCTARAEMSFSLNIPDMDRVVIDIFQKYRQYSISMPALKVSSIPISILCRKSIHIEIDTSISILL